MKKSLRLISHFLQRNQSFYLVQFSHSDIHFMEVKHIYLKFSLYKLLKLLNKLNKLLKWAQINYNKLNI